MADTYDYIADTYDYIFDCGALNQLLPDATMLTAGPAPAVIVTHWRGTEGVSKLYRFDITVAVARGGLALEKLLDQPATLSARAPDGSVRRWHGIVTEAAEQGRDDTHHYYEVTLEPRLARLREMRWSDIYLGKDLSDLIQSLLANAALTSADQGNGEDFDFRIAVPDLTATKAEFVCQFEESCLDFLLRKLEHYGVYFWFEQGTGVEGVVFANSVDQQPVDADAAVYYPKGVIDPDASQIAITQLNRRVGLPPRRVVLHDAPVYGNTTLRLSSEANVPLPGAARALGEVHSAGDHFEQVQNGAGVPGETLATWRAQELACNRLRVQGQARTPGIRPGRYLTVSEYLRGVDARDYYVIEVTHEGTQTLETAPRTDLAAYRASFVALPRYLDPDDATSALLQYRPPRITPVPQVDRLVNGFIDVAVPAAPKRYAQPDGEGRYKVRFLFARQRYDGNMNSAFVRMATPYAGGSPTTEVANAGMHFPLREGTEVLLAFLNGDPDRPVIVAALPNTEAPSLVGAENAAQHVIGTPAGNSLVLADAQPGGEGAPAIRLYSPTEESSLNLGQSDAEGVDDGFHLATDLHGEIQAGKSMLIEVPGHYRMSAGSDDGEVKSSFISSEAEGLPDGVTASQKGGLVIENFTGMKMESVEGVTIGHFIGAKSEMNEGAFFESTLGAKLAVEGVGAKEINLLEKQVLHDSASYTNAVTRWIATKWSGTVAEKSEDVVDMTVSALGKYRVYCPDIWIGSAASFVETIPTAVTVGGPSATLTGSADCLVESSITTTISGSVSSITLVAAGANMSGNTITLDATASIDLATRGPATVNGAVIMVG